MNEIRIRLLQDGKGTVGPVIYWMSRVQRVHDNWAMIYAQRLAFEKKKPLLVVFNLVPDFLGATIRQYGFMLKGLQELESELIKYNILFSLLQDDPKKMLYQIFHRIFTLDKSPLSE